MTVEPIEAWTVQHDPTGIYVAALRWLLVSPESHPQDLRYKVDEYRNTFSKIFARVRALPFDKARQLIMEHIGLSPNRAEHFMRVLTDSEWVLDVCREYVKNIDDGMEPTEHAVVQLCEDISYVVPCFSKRIAEAMAGEGSYNGSSDDEKFLIALSYFHTLEVVGGYVEVNALPKRFMFCGMMYELGVIRSALQFCVQYKYADCCSIPIDMICGSFFLEQGLAIHPCTLHFLSTPEGRSFVTAITHDPKVLRKSRRIMPFLGYVCTISRSVTLRLMGSIGNIADYCTATGAPWELRTSLLVICTMMAKCKSGAKTVAKLCPRLLDMAARPDYERDLAMEAFGRLMEWVGKAGPEVSGYVQWKYVMDKLEGEQNSEIIQALYEKARSNVRDAASNAQKLLQEEDAERVQSCKKLAKCRAKRARQKAKRKKSKAEKKLAAVRRVVENITVLIEKKQWKNARMTIAKNEARLDPDECARFRGILAAARKTKGGVGAANEKEEQVEERVEDDPLHRVLTRLDTGNALYPTVWDGMDHPMMR